MGRHSKLRIAARIPRKSHSSSAPPPSRSSSPPPPRFLGLVDRNEAFDGTLGGVNARGSFRPGPWWHKAQMKRVGQTGSANVFVTEGRGVRLCWVHSKHKGHKGLPSTGIFRLTRLEVLDTNLHNTVSLSGLKGPSPEMRCISARRGGCVWAHRAA